VIDARRIIRLIHEELGKRELARVKRIIGSRTLKAAVELIVDENAMRADLFIPHFWAIWYHDGRGRVSPKNARKLVFFDNPENDPRTRGASPRNRGQVRRLTRAEYEEGLRINQQRFEAGLRPFMFVVDSVRKSRPRPFFKQLEQGAAERADPIVLRVFERELLREIDNDKDTRSETRPVNFDLGF